LTPNPLTLTLSPKAARGPCSKILI
jgi:hypothetical protein